MKIVGGRGKKKANILGGSAETEGTIPSKYTFFLNIIFTSFLRASERSGSGGGGRGGPVGGGLVGSGPGQNCPVARVGGGPRGGGPTGGASHGPEGVGHRRVEGPKFRAIFPPIPPPFSLFYVSLWVSSR